jgi:hypothetical protein
MEQDPIRLNWIATGIVSLVLPGIFNALQSQTYIVNDSPFVKGTTVVIPGKEYKRSGYHNFFWGYHYRKEWSTAIRLENFYLDTAKGGLTPFQEGGGRQSKNLRLRDKLGKEYVLRSVNKDFGKGLKDMDGTFISRIARDQVSIGHPFAAYTITPMIKAAGIYHTRPKIVFVPTQKAFGEFNDKYSEQLYLFEERPDENQEDADNFGNSKNLVGSEKLMEKIYDENDNQVDQVAFVRARLFDIFIGDWGRHPDNWRWAEFDMGKQTIYKPVPRDRDQAYTKIDGFYPDIAGATMPQVQGFGYSIKHIGGWNFPGRPLDQKFLNELTLDEWIMQAKDLQRVLTDSLIENSIRLMPLELFNISGNEIIGKLKSRRNDLQEYAKKYYAYLAKTVTILGSEKKELIEVYVLPDKKVDVDVFKINKEGGKIDTPYYSRQFSPGETKDLFIYGLGKKDIITLKGEKRSKIKVHIIDPQAQDSVSELDNNRIGGIKFYKGNKFEYDTLRDEKINISLIPVFTPSAYKVFDRDPMDLFGRTGIKVSGGVVFTSQPWRKKEYQIVHSIYALYGFLRTSFNVGYVGRFNRAAGKWDLLLKGRVDAPAVENYFGTGNNSKFDNKEINYYRTLSNRVYGGIGLERNFQKMHHAEISLIYQSVKYKKETNHNIGIASYMDPSVFTRKHFAGFEAGYTYDHTNGSICPLRGFTFNFGGGFLRNLSDTGSSFAKVNSAVAVYLPLNKKFTLAMRAAGATLSGDPDFYHLNRLGGNAELRGYERERFYGKSIFYTNTEIRWITNTRNYFFNGRAGLLGFYDIGRVWMPNETSSLWHDGYGMGLILIPFNKITLTAMYGLSSEGDNLFFRAELFF